MSSELDRYVQSCPVCLCLKRREGRVDSYRISAADVLSQASAQGKNKAAFKKAMGACVCMRVHACVCSRPPSRPGANCFLCLPLTSVQKSPVPGTGSCVILTSSRVRMCLHAVLLELVLSSGSLGQACEDCPAVPVHVPQPTPWARYRLLALAPSC